MKVIQSRNPIVDAIGKMYFTGNIIPEYWYETIRYKNEKPNVIAIMILSDIVYWYRPREIRDEATGEIVFERKFRDERFLQRSYQQISEKMGISKRQATNAIVFLEKNVGVIKRHFRNIRTTQGAVLTNVMYIELFPERLREITYPSEEKEDITLKSDMSPQRKGEISTSEERGLTLNEVTYTEITTKTSDKESINQSFIPDGTMDRASTLISIERLKEAFTYQELREILTYHHFLQECEENSLETYEIKERFLEEIRYLIDYEILIVDCEKALVDALIDYMSEIIISKKELQLNGERYDVRVMGNQFYRLDSSSIKYVITKFDEVSKNTRITNKKNYLIRMLLTAKSDMTMDIHGTVNYDMAHWGDE